MISGYDALKMLHAFAGSHAFVVGPCDQSSVAETSAKEVARANNESWIIFDEGTGDSWMCEATASFSALLKVNLVTLAGYSPTP